MLNFLYTFNPYPIIFSFGPVHIYWYGFFIVLGIISALLITLKLARFYDIKKDAIIDLTFWIILAGIIGARVYHIFLELPYYLKYPLNIFKIWNGGLAIHGAIIAGIIVIWIFAKKIPAYPSSPPLIKGRNYPETPLLYKEGQREVKNSLNNFWLLAAILAPGLALAQAIGRWGNYFNQELFGTPTNLPWGIPIDIFNRPAEYASYDFFHPTFLYESIGNFLIFITLISFHIWIIKRGKQNNTFYFLLFTFYLIFYSLLRFSTEFIRIDRTPIFFGLRWPQIMSILIIIASIVILLKNKKSYANIQNSSHNN